MTVAISSWVFSEDIRPSPAKFVLFALADNANEQGIAYPSVALIGDKTSQDRKTVLSSLKYLESVGLLRDTGKRVGRTKQVQVFQIVGIPNSEFHYVYTFTDSKTGEFYSGVRSCPIDPKADTIYTGTSKWIYNARSTGAQLEKSIVGEFGTRIEAEYHSLQLLKQHEKNELCRNRKDQDAINRLEQSLFRNGAESGTVPQAGHLDEVKQYRLRKQTVPLTDGNSTVNGTRNHKETSRKKYIYTEDFLKAWEAYPPRLGDSTKTKAFEAWTARLNQGHTPEEIYAGVLRYAEFCEHTKKTNTEFVMDAKTFFGPGEHFKKSYAIPNGNGQQQRVNDGYYRKSHG